MKDKKISYWRRSNMVWMGTQVQPFSRRLTVAAYAETTSGS